MTLQKLRKALLILGAAILVALVNACDNSAFTRSSDKKNPKDTNAQGGPNNSPYDHSKANPDSPTYSGANAGSQIGKDGASNNVTPNGFSNQNSYNPLGFPGFNGGLNGTGGDTPLVLDWDRDGKITISSAMVAFDINGNGHRERTEWAASNERLLAIDLNGNGRIDSAKELFGSASVDRGTYQNFSNGFLALAAYDVNKDGKIDHQDPVFTRLLLWHDKNSNGISEAGELTPLHLSGVIALNSLYKTLPMGRGFIGNSRSRIGFESVYETKEGLHLLADVIFYNERNDGELSASIKSRREVR